MTRTVPEPQPTLVRAKSNGKAPGAGQLIHVWDLPGSLRLHLTEEMRYRLQTGYYQLHGYGPLYKCFRKSSHRGAAPGVYPGSITIQDLRSVALELNEDLGEVEACITHVFALTRDKSLAGPFPKTLSPPWAFLLGAFFGSGILLRRERQVQFRFDESCLAKIQEVGQAIGSPAVVSEYIQHKTRIPRQRVIFPRPVLECLVQWGVPDIVCHAPRAGRQPTTRIEHLQVPASIIGEAQLRRAFVEGYFATSTTQAAVSRTRRNDNVWEAPRIQIGVRGATQAQVEAFQGFLCGVLDESGTPYHRRAVVPKNGGHWTAVWVSGTPHIQNLQRSFELHRSRIVEVMEAFA